MRGLAGAIVLRLVATVAALTGLLPLGAPLTAEPPAGTQAAAAAATGAMLSAARANDCPSFRGRGFPGTYSGTFTSQDSAVDAQGSEGTRTMTLTLTGTLTNDGMWQVSGSFQLAETVTWKDFYWREGVPAVSTHTVDLQFSPSPAGPGDVKMRQSGQQLYVQEGTSEEQVDTVVAMTVTPSCGALVNAQLHSEFFDKLLIPLNWWVPYPSPSWHPAHLVLSPDEDTVEEWAEESDETLEDITDAMQASSWDDVREGFKELFQDTKDDCLLEIVAEAWVRVLQARQQTLISELRPLVRTEVDDASLQRVSVLLKEVLSNDRELQLLGCPSMTEGLIREIELGLDRLLTRLMEQGMYGTALTVSKWLALLGRPSRLEQVVDALEQRAEATYDDMVEQWPTADQESRARLAREAVGAESTLATLGRTRTQALDFACRQGLCRLRR